MVNKYEIDNKIYELIENYKEKFSLEDVKEKYTEYFEEYDFIVGDFAYDKLRLKGFCEKHNKNFKPINDKERIKKYIKEDCAYECAYFILKKVD
jgi:Uncharacterized protein conserved in bacteria